MPRWDDLFAPQILIQSSFDDMDLSDFAESIVSMEYVSSVRKMDKCVLTIENRDGKFSDDPRLDREIRFLLKWGYPSGLTYAREMLLISAAPALSAGVPTLVWTAYGEGQMLTTTGSRNWGSVSSAEVARRIAALHGLEANVVESNDARREHRLQPPQVSDYEYLARLAEAINYDFTVTRGRLTFVPIDTDAAPAHTFVYYVDGGSILKSFRPTIRKGRIHRRMVAGTDHAGRPVQERPQRQQRALGTTSVQAINLRNSRLGSQVSVREAASDTVRPSPETDPRVHRIHTSADNHAAEMGAVDMTATLVGYPTVEAGQIVRFYVVERRYSGLWRVTEAKHNVDASGEYGTTLKVRRAEVNSATQSGAAVPANQRNRNATSAATPQEANMTAIHTRPATVRPTTIVTRHR